MFACSYLYTLRPYSVFKINFIHYFFHKLILLFFEVYNIITSFYPFLFSSPKSSQILCFVHLQTYGLFILLTVITCIYIFIPRRHSITASSPISRFGRLSFPSSMTIPEPECFVDAFLGTRLWYITFQWQFSLFSKDVYNLCHLWKVNGRTWSQWRNHSNTFKVYFAYPVIKITQISHLYHMTIIVREDLLVFLWLHLGK